MTVGKDCDVILITETGKEAVHHQSAMVNDKVFPSSVWIGSNPVQSSIKYAGRHAMMQNSASLNETMISQTGWHVQALVGRGARVIRYFVALMKEAAVRGRKRRELASLDLHLLRDIGLEPFDIYRGWHRPGR